MTEQDNEQFDSMLRDFFRDALEGQRGQAESHFRRHLKAEGKAVWRHRAFLIGTFITGVAASVAVLWAGPMFHRDVSRQKSVAVAKEDPAVQPVVERLVSSHTSDEGVVMLDDDTPVRVFHRQAIEQTRWFDEHEQMTAQQVSPRDELVFVKLVTY
ncbi:MAG TPA: hypothetical protein VK797_01885 [Tepidisphaeraceae bacterium]|jgi:hypothetical protein|nr:hypothetical protein [Tepidisphaeraceae bacterium]